MQLKLVRSSTIINNAISKFFDSNQKACAYSVPEIPACNLPFKIINCVIVQNWWPLKKTTTTSKQAFPKKRSFFLFFSAECYFNTNRGIKTVDIINMEDSSLEKAESRMNQALTFS